MSHWRGLVTTGLIGTERAGLPASAIPGLPPLAEPADPAIALLDRAALLTVASRAGRLPGRAEPLPQAGPDPRPLVGPAAGRRLGRMLGGEQPALVPEWLRAAQARGLRPPAQLLPALLDGARRSAPAVRHLVVAAGGPRARWLAGLNPEWAFAAEPQPGEDAWRLGDSGRRRDYLAALRAADPDAARDLIRGGWAAAGERERLMFLSVLAEDLALADEPALEAALDDRSDEVRRRAATLLAGLPGSALGRRMAGRARRCLRLEPGRSGLVLTVEPPGRDDPALHRDDPALRRDGIALRRDASAPGPAPGAMAERSRLVLEIVARTPLATWTGGSRESRESGGSRESGLTPAEIVAGRAGAVWAPVLFLAWSRAALAQGDQEWLAALVKAAMADRIPDTAATTQVLRQLVLRADPALVLPAPDPDAPDPDTPDPDMPPDADAPPAIRAALAVLRFRYDMLKELDDGR